MPDVPFLCHFERAVGMTDADPYGEIVRYLSVHRGSEERVFRTLSYFDGVNLAKRATAPALFSTGLLDQVCPPSTVYAARNHYGSRSTEPVAAEISVYAHNEHEGGQAYQWLAQAEFLARQRLIRAPARVHNAGDPREFGAATAHTAGFPELLLRCVRRHARPSRACVRRAVQGAGGGYAAVTCSTKACTGQSVGQLQAHALEHGPRERDLAGPEPLGAIQPCFASPISRRTRTR